MSIPRSKTSPRLCVIYSHEISDMRGYPAFYCEELDEWERLHFASIYNEDRGSIMIKNASILIDSDAKIIKLPNCLSVK